MDLSRFSRIPSPLKLRRKSYKRPLNIILYNTCFFTSRCSISLFQKYFELKLDIDPQGWTPYYEQANHVSEKKNRGYRDVSRCPREWNPFGHVVVTKILSFHKWNNVSQFTNYEHLEIEVISTCPHRYSKSQSFSSSKTGK